MSRKIIGVTVGTPLSIRTIKDKLNPVTSINGIEADEHGNVEVNAGITDADKTEILENVLANIPESPQITINGKAPDENGNIEVNGTITEADKAELLENVLANIPESPQITINGKGPDENGNYNIEDIDPDKVIFPDGLNTTYAIGNVTLQNGMATLVKPGGTLADFFNVFVDEKNPTTTQPSVSLTFSQAKVYEVGTKVTPSYSASLNPGSYTYGPATGVTATAWTVSDSDGNTSTEASGTFPEITVGDNTSYSITAKASHTAGAIPLTNMKNEYEAGQIEEGEKQATSSKITGFRKSFYGTTTDKNALTSDAIRGLTGKSSSALSNGSTFTVTIPVGAMRVVFAYPATLRDVSSVKDVNGMNAEIASGFTKTTISVAGAGGYEAIDYKVYTLEYATANDTANTYTVKI